MDQLFRCKISVHFTNVLTVEINLCSFIAEHNLFVMHIDLFPGLIQNLCPDSKPAKII